MARPGTFQKGKSGNPGGRPKSFYSLAEACKKFTPEIVATMVAIMRGQPITRKNGKKETDGKETVTVFYPTFSEQVEAMKWLADRGHGKAATVISNPDGTPMTFTITTDRKEEAPEAT